MKHPSSRELYRYWTTLRGRRPAPARDEIDPSALRRVLGDALILSHQSPGGPVIRLAGTRVCALFCRELKAAAFLRLWRPESRDLMNSLINIVAAELTAVVAGAQGRPRGEAALPLELLLLPLAPGATGRARLIGVLAPLAPVDWIGLDPVETLSLGTFRHIAAEPATALAARTPIAAYPGNPVRRMLPQRPPRKTPHLVVHEGGAAAKSARSEAGLREP